MKQRLFNRALADRGDRLAPVCGEPGSHVAQASQEPDRAHAAGAAFLPASAAFAHFTESCLPCSQGGQGEPAPGVKSCVPGAVVLSDHAMILLHAIAAYEQCSNGRAVMLALADYVIKIGAGPLARAALDASELAGVVEDRISAHGHTRRGENRFGSVLTLMAPDGALAEASDAHAGLRPEAGNGALDDQRAVVTALKQDASELAGVVEDMTAVPDHIRRGKNRFGSVKRNESGGP